MRDTPDLPGRVSYGGLATIRFAEIDGVLEVVAVEAPAGLTAEALHAVPVARLKAWANGPQSDEIRAILGADDGEVIGLPPGGTWGKAGPRPSPKLKIPEGRRRPDSFYVKVAEVAEGLRVHGVRNPAVEIAEANEVPVTTVHRWLKEARERETRRAIMESETLGDYLGRRLTSEGGDR